MGAKGDFDLRPDSWLCRRVLQTGFADRFCRRLVNGDPWLSHAFGSVAFGLAAFELVAFELNG